MLVKRKQKKFGVLGAVGKIWNKGALGKTAVIGTGLAAAGTAVGGAKFASASKDALTGNMGED